MCEVVHLLDVHDGVLGRIGVREHLESLGVIETLPGKGCFLKENNSPLKKEVRRKMLIEEIDQAIVQAHHLQVSRDEFLDLVHERLDALEDKRRANEDDKED